MTLCVEKTNKKNQQPPKNLEELVRFVEFVRTNTDSVFVQIAGYGEEVVKELAHHFQVNFFSIDQVKKPDLNAFTIIYIDHDGQVTSRPINEKSKLIIYAHRKPSHSNY